MKDIEKIVNDTLLFIAQRSWTNDKQGYCDSLALFIAENLGVAYVLVSKLLPSKKDVESISYVAHRKLMPNIRYSLSDTPCENVISENLCYHNNKIQEKFPRDKMLVEMKAESYIGVPLWDANGSVIGLIVLLDTKAVADFSKIETLLQIVAIRTAHEIEQGKYEKELIEAKEIAEESEFFFKESQRAALIGSYKLVFDKGSWKSSKVLDEIFGISESYKRSIEGWVDIVHPDDREMMSNYLRDEVMEARQSFDKEYRIVRKNDNEVRWVLGLGELEIDEDIKAISLIGTIQDVTDRKLSELELLEAKEKAEESDRLKSAFLANMSHEIRTPMNGILGFLSLLKEPGLKEDKKRIYSDLVNESGTRLLNTLSDIIEISKIDSGLSDDHLEIKDIRKFIASHAGFFKQKTDEKGLELILHEQQWETPLYIKIDKVKFNAILFNLFNNAVKYTNQGSVEVGNSINEDSVVYYVRDTGVGIPESRLEAIFERFVQAERTENRTHEGSGLGLTIAKSYTETLGGRIWVQSELGKGSTFFFSLPVEQSSSPKKIRSGDQEPQEKSLKGVTILVAEDDETSFEFLETILQREGISIIHALNGHEAVRAIKDNPEIALILMDIRMPELSGLDASRQIRQVNLTVPIIAQTAYAQSSDRSEALEAGCVDHIAKPINRMKLIELIQKYI